MSAAEPGMATARLREDFVRDGYVITTLFAPQDAERLESFAFRWIREIFSPWMEELADGAGLEQYHVWSRSRGVPHDVLLQAPQRHCVPPPEVADVFRRCYLERVLAAIGCHRFRFWDEGLGWLAFRLIRPGMNDGYPLSRKSWGPAKNVISCWIPVVGRGPRDTLLLVPGSHRQDYPRTLPAGSKFCPGEFRFAGDPAGLKTLRPVLRPGQVVLFSADLLHSEDVTDGDKTRLNLELRIEPLAEKESGSCSG